MNEMTDSPPVTGRRSRALDAHRGLIMMLMAIDHASYFIARVHSRELWGTPLPVYPDALWFWTRWITHPCATGFFFLMGIGMIFFADAHRNAGWKEGRITRSFVIRGLLLIALQLTIENGAWIVGDLSGRPGAAVTRGGPMPGGGTEGMIYLGVLFSLGGTMLFWAFMRRAPSWLVAVTSMAAVICTQSVIPGPDRTQVVYSPLVRAFLIPGHSNMLEVLYPVVPWLGVTGLGLLFGRLLQRRAQRAVQAALWTGLGLLILFAGIRVAGGFGNLNVVPTGWMGFLNVVKYPPSLAFLTVTLGINLLLITSWRWIEPGLRSPYNPLVLFGRTALFFYLLHLWIYGLLGLLFRDGSNLATMYAFWLLGLAILYPLCYWYDHFKRRKPTHSIWRFF
jgi:uncharacterized membrane protein